MATVIRRSSEMGDPMLRRQPFPEPGPQPIHRLSALAFQGAHGDQVVSVPDADGVGNLTNGSQGTSPVYRIAASGVPGFEFDSTLQGTSTPKRPTIYRAGATGDPVVLSQLAVFRVLRAPNGPTGSLVGFGHIIRASLGSSTALAIASEQDSARAGRIIATSGAGGTTLAGPLVPADGALHFGAVVYDGTTVRLFLDGEEVVGAGVAPTDNAFVAGYAFSDSNIEIVEAAQYSVALTRAQVAAKWTHYRALDQF